MPIITSSISENCVTVMFHLSQPQALMTVSGIHGLINERKVVFSREHPMEPGLQRCAPGTYLVLRSTGDRVLNRKRMVQ